MVIHAPFFILALVLLWFPRRLMRFGAPVLKRKKRARSADGFRERRESGDPRVTFSREFRKPRNYFDLLRGIVGGLALVGGHGIAASVAADSPDENARWIVLGVQAAVLLVGLLIQTYRREHQKVLFFAPIFYLAGMSVALSGAWTALFAFILVWSLNPILGKAQTFLAMYAVLIGGFCWLLEKVAEELEVICIVLILMPVLLSLLTRRPLVVFSRKAFHPEAGAA